MSGVMKARKGWRGRAWLLLGLLVVSTPSWPLRAADTIEPYDPGFSDFEGYAHWKPMQEAPGPVLAEVGVGYGITPRVSALVGGGWEQDPNAEGGRPRLTGTLFGTLLDTDHVDLDLYLGAGTVMDGSGAVEWVPGFELNLDVEPGLTRAGAYLRVEGPVTLTRAIDTPGGAVLVPGMAYLVGGYVTLAGRHQLLVELPAGVSLEHGLPREDVIPGEVVLGYNVHVQAHVEVITELSLDWSDVETGDLRAGVMAGVIVTR